MKSNKPNFLIIMSDQHSPDTIAGKGHPAVKTPTLDCLMSSGITFTNAYCSYPMCTPSRAGFSPLLFDLEQDPYEWTDLSKESSSRDILEELYKIACSTGWNAETLKKELLLHKRRLRYISEAESEGS